MRWMLEQVTYRRRTLEKSAVSRIPPATMREAPFRDREDAFRRAALTS